MVSREKVSPAPGKQRFPMEIRCYGRRYVVETVSEALACMEALIEKRLMDANRYRVGKSWPRGQRRPRKWICGDCWLSHMWWTERCPVSLRSGRTRSYSVRGDRHMATVRSHNKVVRVKPRARDTHEEAARANHNANYKLQIARCFRRRVSPHDPPQRTERKTVARMDSLRCCERPQHAQTNGSKSSK